MSKTYILWIPHIVMHIETYYSRLFSDAEELFVQSFPMPSKITLKCWDNFGQQYFIFYLY